MKVIEEGFDMNQAKGGLLGKGIYFADSAGKSDAYTGGLPNGKRQILQCQVVLGRTQLRKSYPNRLKSQKEYFAARTDRTALSSDIQDGYDR